MSSERGRHGSFVFPIFNLPSPLISPSRQIVSYLLDLPEKDEEEVQRAQINNFDTLWGETGKGAGGRHTPTDRRLHGWRTWRTFPRWR